MCGITGFISTRSLTVDALRERVAAMNRTLAHRGPDADGIWSDPDSGVSIGHRRLSVVDVSSAGAQPMRSRDERWIISYNGELYNTDELRHELEASGLDGIWRGHSDTEVMLEAVSRWGVSDAVKKFNGMFAFALWDRKDRRLWLARDRLGIKPLLWSRVHDGTFLFASELRALTSYPEFVARINPHSVAAYMRHACVPAPLTIFEGVYKLPPGQILTVSQNAEPKIAEYWDLLGIAAQGQLQIDTKPEPELTDELEALLRDAVLRQMVSDVPLGAFLSGGVDSSTVVALMQAQSTQRVHTFSVGSQDKRYDEASYAKKVAQHLGTDHTEIFATPSEARAVVEGLPEIYDEPFADSSQIPTFLVSKLARKSVTVALSGDGGDECFGGYVRHQWIDRLTNFGRLVPPTLSKSLSSALGVLAPSTWDMLFNLVPRQLRPVHAGDKIQKFAALLPLTNPNEMYRRVIAQWPQPSEVMRGVTELAEPWDALDLDNMIPDVMSRLRYLDLRQYLPDDILTKVDRASMAVSLEVRVPLLDHRVVEYTWRLPKTALQQGTRGKKILRNILRRYVPSALVDRPKTGFAVPIGDWIRGPLSSWTEDLLSTRALESTGFFNTSLIQRRLKEHRDNKRDWSHALWTILMFQAWHEHWIASHRN